MFARIAGDNIEEPKRSDLDKPLETLDQSASDD